MIWSWKRDCHAKSGWIFQAFFVTPILKPRIIDARFFDWGPNLLAGLDCRDAKFCVSTLRSLLGLLIMMYHVRGWASPQMRLILRMENVRVFLPHICLPNALFRINALHHWRFHQNNARDFGYRSSKNRSHYCRNPLFCITYLPYCIKFVLHPILRVG